MDNNGLSVGEVHRIERVAEEISRRKQQAQPANPSHFVAQQWVKWLKRELSEGQKVFR
jgi:hypothetical protein